MPAVRVSHPHAGGNRVFMAHGIAAFTGGDLAARGFKRITPGQDRCTCRCLASLPRDVVEIAVLYLSGALPQGRIGLGYRVVQSAAAQEPAGSASLDISEVDATLQSIAATEGVGSAARRATLLAGLFAAATADEQDFLRRLLAGELRQGAQEGIMIDAIAAAAKLPPQAVRRAAMYAPSLGRLAAAALSSGTEGLHQFGLQIFNPVVPMLAQTAADADEALRELTAPVQFEWKMDRRPHPGAQARRRGAHLHPRAE